MSGVEKINKACRQEFVNVLKACPWKPFKKMKEIFVRINYTLNERDNLNVEDQEFLNFT